MEQDVCVCVIILCVIILCKIPSGTENYLSFPSIEPTIVHGSAEQPMIEKTHYHPPRFINRREFDNFSRNNISPSEFKRRFCVNATRQNVILLLKPNNLHR